MTFSSNLDVETQLRAKGIYVFPLIFGIFFGFGGLIFPGLAWSLLTPGIVDQFSLTLVTAIGIIGMLLIFFAGCAYLFCKLMRR